MTNEIILQSASIHDMKLTQINETSIVSYPIDETIMNETTAKSSPKHETPAWSYQHVRFIPHPHKTLGSGVDVQCQWETGSITSNTTSGSRAYDSTQRAAFTEGVCIPPHLNALLHVFSSAEAIECLRYPTRVVVSGDSYMKQLFIGFADILLSKQLDSNREILNSLKQKQAVASAQHWLARRHQKDSSFPYLGSELPGNVLL